MKFLDLTIPSKSNNFHPHLLRRTALVVYATFLLIVNLFVPAALGIPSSQVSAADISASRLVDLANSSRAQNGLDGLSVDSRLEAAARAKGQNMFELDYWSHFGPNGESPWDFITQAGYSYIYAGENLAKDFTTTDAIHSAWMASETHRENILKPQYTEVGIAVVEGDFNGTQTTIVVQMFGTPASVSQLPQTAPSQQSDTAAPAPESVEVPEITSPQKDEQFNTQRVIISGNSNEPQVSVYIDGDLSGTLNVEGGAFDYQPVDPLNEGDHSTFAKAFDPESNIYSEESETVEFVIDITPPEISASQVEVELKDSEKTADISIDYDAAEDVVSANLNIGDNSFGLEKTEDGFTFNQEVGKSVLESALYSGFLVATDQAGNQASIELDLSISDFGSVIGAANSITSAISLPTFDLIDNLSLIGKINLFFAVFLITLMAIDTFSLWRKGVLREGSKSLFGVFLLTFAVLTSLFVGSEATVL